MSIQLCFQIEKFRKMFGIEVRILYKYVLDPNELRNKEIKIFFFWRRVGVKGTIYVFHVFPYLSMHHIYGQYIENANK